MPKPTEDGWGKAWSGRLQAEQDPRMERFATSIGDDLPLAALDVAGSRAHATALAAAGILEPGDLAEIRRGLEQLAGELERGEFQVLDADEDIHMAVERRLTELVGDPGRRLHTGRSRNDQVALDLRLWAREGALRLGRAVIQLQEVLLRRARSERRTVMPGYTHLQRAQPVHLAHHLMAYFEMLDRDLDRLRDAHRRAGVSPLGSGALAGTSLPVDRRIPAAELGLPELSANSMDAVSDRDFAADLLFAAALIAVHLSRLAEDLVIWSTSEFGFVELPDRWATGSSLMPQKKNPDLLELVRGRAARPTAALLGLLVVLKGLPLTYNRDLQEDKHHLIPAVEGVEESLLVMAGFLSEVQFQRSRMAAAASAPELLATDLAERLVREGVPFRRAHEAIGAAVRRSAERGEPFAEGLRRSWREIGFQEDPSELLDPRRALAAREQPGAPGPAATATALARAARRLRREREWAGSQGG